MDTGQSAQGVGGQDWHRSHRGLKRIKDLLFRLGNPQRKLKFIHVAGTNGKGSTAAMLDSIYRAAGYTTGLYTSPHLESYTERIRVNGEDISAKTFTTLVQIIHRQAKEMEEVPTEFEILTAMAMAYFYMKRCDIVILEVGLGGRFDATNVIPPPEAVVFTPIGLDHMEQLGDTVEAIAKEKSGIIKPKSQVVSSLQIPSVEAVLTAAAKSADAPFLTLPLHEISLQKTDDEGQVFDFGRFHDVRIPFHGSYQIYNAATAIATVRVLREKGWDVDKKDMYQGLAEVRWPGRFEILHEDPIFVLDGAHNLPGIQTLFDTAETYWPDKKIAVLMGILADKEYENIVKEILPHVWKVVAVTPNSPRALPADHLVDVFKAHDFPNAVAVDSVAEGVQLLFEEAEPDDVIVAMGTLYISAEVKECFPIKIEEILEVELEEISFSVPDELRMNFEKDGE